MLADLQGGVDLEGIFSHSDLDELLAGVLARQGLSDPDRLPELPVRTVTRPGDVWVLGDLGHRLGCGDATDDTLVARVVNGGRPRLLVVDPPYGVELNMEWRDGIYNALAPAERSYLRPAGISGDTVADWSAAYELVPSLEVAYVWHGSVHACEVAAGLQRLDFELRQQIIWVKTAFVIGHAAYNWQHEPCWYAVKKGCHAQWIGSRDQSTVWELPSPKAIMGGSEEARLAHPCQKPLETMSRPIGNHSGDVYDCFLGSGTTLVACESLGRRCYALEVEPRYVDLAVLRWQQFAGQQATLEDDGRTYAAVAAERTSEGPQVTAAP